MGITGFESPIVGWALVAIGGTGLAVSLVMACLEVAGWLQKRYPSLRLPRWACVYRQSDKVAMIAFAIVTFGYAAMVLSFWYPALETFGRYYVIMILVGIPVSWVALRLRD